MNAALEISGLHKSYGRLAACAGVSLSIAPGEVLALLGPNGSGKTTCLRCAAGLLRADAGTITVGGYDLRRDYRRARSCFSYLPQQASFPANLRVFEVLQFHAALRNLPPASIDAALSEVELSPQDAGRFVGQLSGGMRQRVSLAVSCLPGAGLMLLDEPTANLDPAAALHFRTLARAWRERGRALLLSTHVLKDVEELADKVVVLVGGRVVAAESTQELRSRLSRWARLRVDVGAATEAHRNAALSSGAVEAKLNSHAVLVSAPVERRLAILDALRALGPVHRFDTEQPALEDIYLEYIRSGQA